MNHFKRINFKGNFKTHFAGKINFPQNDTQPHCLLNHTKSYVYSILPNLNGDQKITQNIYDLVTDFIEKLTKICTLSKNQVVFI
jgi:hypothetical protein